MSQMPPSEAVLPAADLWAQITAIPRPSRVVPFPRNGKDGKPLGEIHMIILTQEENMMVTVQAERWVRKTLKENDALASNGEPRGGYDTLIEERSSIELLFRCCKEPDLIKPFFPTIEGIGKKLTTDEIAVLVQQYTILRAELGPVLNGMGQEEMDAWIEKLARGGSTFPFASLSLGERSRLLLYMASRLYPSPTDSSSPGTQPE